MFHFIFIHSWVLLSKFASPHIFFCATISIYRKQLVNRRLSVLFSPTFHLFGEIFLAPLILLLRMYKNEIVYHFTYTCSYIIFKPYLFSLSFMYSFLSADFLPLNGISIIYTKFFFIFLL